MKPAAIAFVLPGYRAVAQQLPAPAAIPDTAQIIRSTYTNYDYRIPMRDGVKLLTYVPKDSAQQYPILIQPTPYPVAPFGVDNDIDVPWRRGGPGGSAVPVLVTP